MRGFLGDLRRLSLRLPTLAREGEGQQLRDHSGAPVHVLMHLIVSKVLVRDARQAGGDANLRRRASERSAQLRERQEPLRRLHGRGAKLEVILAEGQVNAYIVVTKRKPSQPLLIEPQP